MAFFFFKACWDTLAYGYVPMSQGGGGEWRILRPSFCLCIIKIYMSGQISKPVWDFTLPG